MKGSVSLAYLKLSIRETHFPPNVSALQYFVDKTKVKKNKFRNHFWKVVLDKTMNFNIIKICENLTVEFQDDFSLQAILI